MLAIWKRELQSYFYTPVGYVFMGVFLTLSGLIFYLYNLQNLSGDLLTFLSQLTLLVMLLSPLLTMRLICEDRQKRTDQLIFTSPAGLGSVVLAKYLAAACIMLITVLASGPLIALSLALGLASRNQMAAYFFSLPVILVSFAPMFCMYSEAAFQALPLLLSGGGFALVYALAEGTLLAPASILPAVAQLAWIVASLIALVMVAPGIPRDDQ